jgi:iron complex transport system ATP-binding protein
MVFDEPMSALDFGNQNRLLEIFRDLQAEGKTVIFTTHNPNQVLDLNCNAIVLDKGTVVCSGPAQAVVTKNLLEKIYKRAFVVTKKHFSFEE